MVMGRSFARHPGGGLLLVIPGCGIRFLNVNDVGHMRSVIALRVGNGGRNHPADQGSQNQQQTEEPTAHCTPASMSAAVR